MTCELGMKNRQILKCGTADLSYVEQKRNGCTLWEGKGRRTIHLLRTDWKIRVEALRRSKYSKELAERTDLILDGHSK